MRFYGVYVFSRFVAARWRAILLLIIGFTAGMTMGTSTAAHAATPPVAPPVSAAAPISSMPATSDSLIGSQWVDLNDHLTALLVISCAPDVHRPAWAATLTYGTDGTGAPTTQAKIPMPDTTKIGWPVEVVAFDFGNRVAAGTGCTDDLASAMPSSGWGALGEEGSLSSIQPPPSSMPLAILPGASSTPRPASPVAPPIPTPTAISLPPPPMPSPGPYVGSYAPAPDGIAQASAPTGGGRHNQTPAYLLLAAALIFAAWSRRRVRADLAQVEHSNALADTVRGFHGGLGAGIDILDALAVVLAPLCAGGAVATWSHDWVSWGVALGMGVLAGLTVAQRLAVRRGVHLRLRDVLDHMHDLPRDPRALASVVIGAGAGAGLALFSGWSAATSLWAGVAVLIVVVARRAVGAVAAAAANRAALANRLAAVLGVSPARLDEINWSIDNAGCIHVPTPPEAMLRLDKLSEAVGTVLPDYEVVAADSHMIVLSPASHETHVARAVTAESGGLITAATTPVTAAPPSMPVEQPQVITITEDDLR